MSVTRMESLKVSAIASLIAAGVLTAFPAAAQETAKPQPATEQAAEPVVQDKAVPASQETGSLPDYRDDRSTPQALIES